MKLSICVNNYYKLGLSFIITAFCIYIAFTGENYRELSELKKEAELAGYGMLYMQIEQLEANYENYYRPAREMNPEGLQREINKIQKMQSADGEVTDAERVLVEY